jgi:Phycobilisome protein
MQSHFEILFEVAGERFSSAEELSLVTQYVAALPERLKTYQLLRDQELPLLQKVANQLQENLPEASAATLEHSLKNGALVLRYCAMGLLLNDESYVRERIASWSRDALPLDQNPADAMVYHLMTQQLNQLLSAQQQALCQPLWVMATDMLGPTEVLVEAELTLAAMF